MHHFIQSWRWYGPNDPVSLRDIKQAGATNIVSALHQIAHGEIWTEKDIAERKKTIENAGLTWGVVESVPVHEEIKTAGSQREKYLENYRRTLKNLAAAGIETVCYNFMPVLDWTRTQLNFPVDDGSLALRFDWADLAVFDLYILKRKNAESDYSNEVLTLAEKNFNAYSSADLKRLENNILMGVPTEAFSTVEQITKSIEVYKDIGKDGLRENFKAFLLAIADTCNELGVKMTLHPDDPPYSILGLPRIAGSKEDLQFILNAVDQEFNGLCFCTGSLGSGLHNDVVDILKAVKDRVYFTHLRNVRKDKSGNFYEANHLDGDVDMTSVVEILLRSMQKRKYDIPMRPDHGHQMLDDISKVVNPGYSAIGRLRGLAELRGLEMGISRFLESR